MSEAVSRRLREEARCRPSPMRPGRIRGGFSLMEMMAVVGIMAAFIMVSYPMLSGMVVNTRLNSAAARFKGAILQAQNVLADSLAVTDRNDTMPRVVNARYAGVAMVVRWDDVHGEYEVFHAQHVQTAKNAAGQFLASQPIPQMGYARVAELEPLTLGAGVRIAGLRRNNAKPGGLEVVPDNFVITMNPQFSSVPFTQQVYVNLATTPSSPSSGIWNTAGLYAGGDGNQLATGNGFLTSLPMVVLYYESDLGGPATAGTDPNDLLKVARARVVTFPLQGGAPLDF